MWMKYSVLSCKLVTCFSTFSIFTLSGKNGKSLRSSYSCLGYWTSTLRKYPSSFFVKDFYEIFMKLKKIFYPLIRSKFFTGSFCDIGQPYKLFTSQYSRYNNSLFLSCSFIYLLLAFAYRWITWHILL